MDHILGQSTAIDSIQAAVNSGRVHHAWIFHGPQGVGKMTTALAFAKLLLDPGAGPDLTGRVTIDPDGRIARMVDDESHPDLHFIRKELALHSADATVRRSKLTGISIAVIRQWMIGGTVGEQFFDAVAFASPHLGHHKVFIVDEAELLADPAANAMLKTLEEPPPGTYLILLTTQEERLPPTIRSRCQRVCLTPLGEADMETWLNTANLDVTTDELTWIKDFAQGAPGRATQAAEEGLYQWHQQLTPLLREIESGSFPPTLGQTLAGLVEEHAKAYVSKYPNASKTAGNHRAAGRVFHLFSAYIRQQLRRAVHSDQDSSLWIEAVDVVRDAEAAIDRNVNFKLVFDDLAAQLTELVQQPTSA